MKKHLGTLLLAVMVGVLGFAVSGVAVAGVNDKPPSPPGQDECEHGNSAKPCKEDPQPDKGKDCELHGNNGGVNEDHCKGDETTTETTPTTPTTPTDTTPTETTTPTDSTPSETTPNDTTPQVTVPTSGGSNASPPSTPSSEPSSTQATESPAAPTIVGTPPVAAAAKKQAEALGAADDAPKPSRQAQQAPLTL